MKHFKHFMLTMLVAFVSSLSANAYDFEYNGLYYKITSSWNSPQNTCEVTYGPSGKGAYDDKSDYTLENVVIPEGVAYNGARYLVTAVGKFAFYQCNSIKTLKVEGNVEKIGQNAFNYCTNLESVILNESVKRIESNAFANDSEIHTFEMPGVEYLGKESLAWTKGIKTISIPACTKFFEATAFACMRSLESIIVDPENPYYYSEDGILYSKDKKHIKHFPEASELTEFCVPEGVEEIDSLCFFWSGLSKITVPGSVKKIRCRAFGSCYNLEELNLPQTVEEMGEYATFMYCPKLKQIVIPNSVKIIGPNSYIGLVPNLETVVFGESIEQIGGQYGYDCISLGGSYFEGIPANEVLDKIIILSNSVPTGIEKLPKNPYIRRKLPIKRLSRNSVGIH